MKTAPVVAAAPLLAFSFPTEAAAQAGPSGTQKMQQQMMSDVPHRGSKLGTVSVANTDDPSGWTQFQLAELAPSN